MPELVHLGHVAAVESKRILVFSRRPIGTTGIPIAHFMRASLRRICGRRRGPSNLRGPVEFFPCGIWRKRRCRRDLPECRLEHFLADHLFIARGVGNVTNDEPLELAHINQCRANITGAECGEHCGLAEIATASIANGGSFAVSFSAFPSGSGSTSVLVRRCYSLTKNLHGSRS